MPKGTKILLVDDDKMLIDLYKERLELAGFNVEISRDGEEGLAKIHTVKPDLVLLDIMMPKVNGYEALASIKSDPATKDIPVIILSALMRDINKSKAVESGADDYIIKSEAMPADVIQKIEAVLKKYHKVPPTPETLPAPASSPIVPEPPTIGAEPPVAPEPAAPEQAAPEPTVPVVSPSSVVEPPSQTAPPTTDSSARNPNPEIQFEPFDGVYPEGNRGARDKPVDGVINPSIGGQELTSVPSAPAPNAVPERAVPPLAAPATQPPQQAPAKTSGTITFFLMVILILLLASIASNILLYMRFIAVQ